MSLGLESRVKRLEKAVRLLNDRLVDLEIQLDKPNNEVSEPKLPGTKKSGYNPPSEKTVRQSKEMLDHLRRFDKISWKSFKELILKETDISKNRFSNILKKLRKENKILVEKETDEDGNISPYIYLNEGDE